MDAHRPIIPPAPPGFRAEDFTEGPVGEGFVSVSRKAHEEGVDVEDVLRHVNAAGWEVRAQGGQLWYRPAVVTRMGS